VKSDERKDNSGGFSLLEMIAVITLILTLATFAMPIYHSMVVHAREATLREDLFTLRSQIDRFTHDNFRTVTSGEWRATDKDRRQKGGQSRRSNRRVTHYPASVVGSTG